MEIQLQELIDRIKTSGVEEASKQASEVLENANAEARRIIENAKKEADKILADAKAENERIVRTGEDAIRQAGRNMLLSFRESVTRELDAVVNSKVTEAYSEKALPELIAKVVAQWSEKSDCDDITVILSSRELASLEGALLDALKAHMQKGVTLKTSDSFDGGFRIAVDGGRIYYDYSAEAVTEMLCGYLSPKTAALMKEAAGV